MLGDGAVWTVEGSGHVGIMRDDDERTFAAGEDFEEPLTGAVAHNAGPATETGT